MIPVMKWQDRMRRECRSQGINQRQLSEKAGIPYNRIRKYASGKGDQPRDDAVMQIAKALGVEFLWLRDNIPPKHEAPSEGTALAPDTISSHTAPSTAGVKERGSFGGPRDVPVHKTIEAGDGTDAVISSEISDLAERPPGIIGAVGVYAIFMKGDSMAPRYEHGEIVYVHPDRPMRNGSYVLAGYPDNRILLRQLVSRTEAVVILRRFNPQRDERHPPESFAFMHHVLSLNELVGF